MKTVSLARLAIRCNETCLFMATGRWRICVIEVSFLEISENSTDVCLSFELEGMAYRHL